MRSEFLSKVSQKLRVPLSTIKGSTTMALTASSPPDPVETRHLFQIIDDQANLLRSLINDLLDMTQVEAGDLSFVTEPTDVPALVDHARSTFLLSGARNPVDVDLPGNLPQVMAEKQRILQVLDRLFVNASKYSPHGSTIRVTAWAADLLVAISVADESRGISAVHLPNQVEKFSWIDSENREQDVRASLLSLAICKGIVEAHGGRIWAVGVETGGSTRITFAIPVADKKGQGHRIPVLGGEGKGLDAQSTVEDPQPPRAGMPPLYRLGNLTIDYEERSVTLAGRQVELTPTEYRLLHELSANAGRVLTHRQLGERVWGSGHSDDPQAVRGYVKDIRQKLGDDARNPTYIFTANRVGYRMAKPT